MVLNNIQAEGTVLVHVGMEHITSKPYSRRFVRVFFTKCQSQGIYSSFPRGIWWTKNSGTPHKEVIVIEWTSTTPLFIHKVQTLEKEASKPQVAPASSASGLS